MHPFRSPLIAAAVLASFVRAQYMDITFYDDNTYNCGQGSLSSTDAVTISILSIPTGYTCLGLDEVFLNRNGTDGIIPDPSGNNNNNTFQVAGNICPAGQDACGMKISRSGFNNYNSSANYSQIFYVQPSTSGSSDSDSRNPGPLVLQTYNGENCRQTGLTDECRNHPNPNCTLGPWYQWTCTEDEGSCGKVNYNVKSIALQPREEESGRSEQDGKCVVRAEYAGVGAVKANLGLLGVMLLVAGSVFVM